MDCRKMKSKVADLKKRFKSTIERRSETRINISNYTMMTFQESFCLMLDILQLSVSQIKVSLRLKKNIAMCLVTGCFKCIVLSIAIQLDILDQNINEILLARSSRRI
ncbi:hypothetical protein WA026_010088 [Henosepilachna vigintioctopunctata]|uniref:Uncharacterized protein n=1 Tax=Henosepilachna vigintioctopunctata TaxID=420089 RepID=A0AAW1UGD1_9CUCU